MNAPALRGEMIAPDQNEARNHAPEREPWDSVDDAATTPSPDGDVAAGTLATKATDVSPAASTDAELLNSVHAFLRRFIALPTPTCIDTVTLWAAHAHMIEHFHTTPRLAALSAEPESGKSRVLEILDLLVPCAMLVISPSAPSIFRRLSNEQITLLLDEVDTVFSNDGKNDQNEDLRALLNSGYRRGASISRCVGPDHTVVNFKVFGAVALAGIGNLPDPILTRAIVIGMRRRSASEHVEPYRLRLHEAEGHQLRDYLAQWAEAVGPAVGAAWPTLPEGVVDRRAEAWEPLIAVADAAGGDWPERARVAAVADVAAYRERAPSLGIRLLNDLRRAFLNSDSLLTEKILKSLNELDESPWGNIKGRPLDARGLATRLKPYGVSPKNIRNGDGIHKGYNKAD